MTTAADERDARWDAGGSIASIDADVGSRQVPAPSQIIEERFRGLMISVGMSPLEGHEHQRQENNSELWYRLDRALEDLVYGLFQSDQQEQVDAIVQDIHEVIHEEAVRRVLATGTAAWAGRYAHDEAAS